MLIMLIILKLSLTVVVIMVPVDVDYYQNWFNLSFNFHRLSQKCA